MVDKLSLKRGFRRSTVSISSINLQEILFQSFFLTVCWIYDSGLALPCRALASPVDKPCLSHCWCRSHPIYHHLMTGLHPNAAICGLVTIALIGGVPE